MWHCGVDEQLPAPPPGLATQRISCRCLQHAGLPGGVLSHVEGVVHYLDLAGLQARSLRDFGAPPPLGPLPNRAQPPRAVRQLGLSACKGWSAQDCARTLLTRHK